MILVGNVEVVFTRVVHGNGVGEERTWREMRLSKDGNTNTTAENQRNNNLGLCILLVILPLEYMLIDQDTRS